jgi:chemotaxis protein histidine kinase CheA
MSTPSKYITKPTQVKKSRTISSVVWQVPVQSSLDEKQTLESVDEEASVEETKNAPGINDKCSSKEDTETAPALNSEERRESPDDISVLSAESHGTSVSIATSVATAKTGNVTPHQERVEEPAKQDSTAVAPKKTKQSKLKKRLRMSKGLGKGSETLSKTELKPKKQTSTKVLKPTKLQSRKEKSKKGFKMW